MSYCLRFILQDGQVHVQPFAFVLVERRRLCQFQ
jgi:hypothetical protein